MEKYQYKAEALKGITKETRTEWNQYFESMEEIPGSQKENAFNLYTGWGGLHEFKRKDFVNFHEYTVAKKEFEMGQFFTPIPLVKKIATMMRMEEHEKAADLSCGKGTFFNFVPTEKNCFGIEYQKNTALIAQNLFPDAQIHWDSMGDTFNAKYQTMDYIFGNPPFNLRTKLHSSRMTTTSEDGCELSQFLYLRLAAEFYLKPGGILALIVPMSFLSDRFMEQKYFNYFDNYFSFIGQTKLHKATFQEVGVEDFQTKLIFAHAKTDAIVSKKFAENEYCNIQTLDKRVEEYQKQRRSLKNIIKLADSKRKEKDPQGFEARKFTDKVKALLFHIKANPKTRSHYAECLQTFLTCAAQDDFSESYRQQLRADGLLITRANVLQRLQRALANNEPIKPAQDIIKTKHTIKEGVLEVKINDMVIGNYYPFQNKRFLKLLKRKQQAYQNQEQPFDEMEVNPEINRYLNQFNIITFNDDLFSGVIKLNETQKEDLNAIFQKRYGILNWQQGSGKTIAGYTWAKYLLHETKKVDNVFILGPAVAINLTWSERLKNYGEPFLQIQSKNDVKKMKKGQIIILSLDFLESNKKEIRHYIKSRGHKVALLFDESDEITNYDSKRTQATLLCFRKAKYKMLTTGTTTRNNITELYPQLELIYNNSFNMINHCPTYYKREKRGDLEAYPNHQVGLPFPARTGAKDFQRCFNPEKKTVFGVSQNTQNVYNFDHLQRILGKTIITRKFDEIAGPDKYNVHFDKDRLPQSEAEKAVYMKIIKDFQQMVYRYFNNTGHSRKESMLKIIRQIQLLIKATSIPHKFAEYEGTDYPNKYYYILKKIREWKNEKVALGTVFVDAAEDYYSFLTHHLLNRPVFFIDGSISFNKRKKIIAEFEKTSDGVLISTQQSLKSSVNIPSCNKVLIESLQWNLPKISQYYFRFIRYDSTEKTDVHFVSYEYSIEQNILALLMSKEALNEIVKTKEAVSTAEMFEEYDIDLNLFETLMRKVKDEEGNIHLSWGSAEIC